MRVNGRCTGAQYLNIYLNGKKLDECLEADDEQGAVLVTYRNAENKCISKYCAEKGAMIAEDIQVITLRGDVRIELLPPAGGTEKELREMLEQTFEPLEITYVD